MAETNLTKNKQGYGYKYTDLAEIHNYLEEQGLRYYQYIDRVGEDDYIMTVRIDKDGKESQPIRGSRVVQATLSGKSNPAQEQGSALTYARRYSLLMAFGLATEDDDGQSLTITKKDNDNSKVTETEAKTIYSLVINQKRDLNKFLEYFKIKNTNELTKPQYVEALKILKGE